MQRTREDMLDEVNEKGAYADRQQVLLAAILHTLLDIRELLQEQNHEMRKQLDK